MDLLSRTLIDLLRLTSTPASSADPLEAAPLEDLLPSCFGDALGGPEYASLASGLRAIADGRDDIGAGLTALGTQLEPLRRRLGEDTRLSGRTAQMGEALRDLLMLRRALTSETRPQISLTPSADVFQLLRLVRLRSGADATELVLCSVASTSQRVTVKFAKHHVLDRIELAYEHETAYPQLTLSTQSLAEVAPFAATRTNWIQRDSPEYTLELYNARSLLLGTVITEAVELPYACQGERLTLDMPAGSPLRLLQTSVFDRSQKLIGRCIRVI
jgi:hypothetical protein